MIHEEAESVPPVRALVADASDMRRSAVVEALRGVEPTLQALEASDGPAVLRTLEEGGPELILIDRSLPRLDGDAFVRALETCGPQSLVLLMSESLMPRWQAIVARTKAYDVLLKPFGTPQAERVLRAHARMRSPAKVLLVEPLEAVRKLIRRMLEATRFSLEIEESHGARHALALLRRSPYELVFLDMALPDIGGLAAAVQISALQPEAPIVLIGTAPGASVRSALQAIGAAAYLEKPFEAVELERAIHGAFGLWRPYVLNGRAAA